jgi:hypothetical protein
VTHFDPDQFRGDLNGYLQFRKENPGPDNPHWCARHWAPCPVDGRPGIVASVILVGEAFMFLPRRLRRGADATALNSWFLNQTEPTCCKLGDEKMAFLWDLLRRFQDGELCGDMSVPEGRRACFYNKGHDGPHEHEKLAASIFELMPEGRCG